MGSVLRMRVSVAVAVMAIAAGALTACSTATDDASTVVRTTTKVAGAGLIGIERDTVGLCPEPAPIDDVGRQGESRLVIGSGRATTVPADPQRIVVLDTAALDTTCAVGVWERVVGAATDPTPQPDGTVAQRPTYLGTGIAEIPGVGASDSPDVDAITRLAPDLIVGSDALPADVQARLSAVAPTVLTRAQSTWSDRSLLVATALGRRDAATRALADYRTAAADTGIRLDASRTEASVVRFGPDDAQILGYDSFAGQVLIDVGVRRPGPQQGPTTELSTDDVSAADGDLIYVLFDGADGVTHGTSVMNTDGWLDLGAVIDSRVFGADDSVWSGDGIVAARTVLTDLDNSLDGYVS